MAITFKSSAFANGETIPKKYTGDGDDVSPPLEWSNSPAGTRSYALVVDDPDAPNKVWVHWVIYNLPPDTKSLAEHVVPDQSLENGAKQGKNDFGQVGFSGPAPPPGKPHRYFFHLYALDSEVNLPPGTTKDQLLVSINNHILDEATLTGVYGR